jgi:hypothetical protein
MSILSKLFAAALVLSGIGVARADALKPIQAQAIDLGAVSGTAYYTVERDGYRVVTTLSQGEAGTPLRMVAVLAAGQSVTLSTANDLGAEPFVVEIARVKDDVLVRKAALTN